MRLTIIFAALAMSLPVSAFASDMVMIGQKAVVTHAFIGCKDQADEDKLKDLLRAKDQEAFQEYAMDHFSSCHAFDEGDIGSVEDLSVWHNTTCVRPTGKAYCYYLPTPLLKKSGD